MPSPRRKAVSERVLQAVADAITTIEQDPAAPRTKRHIEALTGLSHDAVARAFAHDRDGHSEQFDLTNRFAKLTAPLAARGDSLESAQAREDRHTIRELRDKNRDLTAQLEVFATALFAHHLSESETRDEREVVTPIRRSDRPT